MIKPIDRKRQLRHIPTLDALEGRALLSTLPGPLPGALAHEVPSPAREGFAWSSTSSAGNVPLNELTDRYQGEDGGLYGGGRNEPPEALAAKALAAAASIQPLDGRGRPDDRGRIGFVTIGASPLRMGLMPFLSQARSSGRMSRSVTFVNGGIDGVVAQEWAGGEGPWNGLAGRVRSAGLTPRQVQVAFIEAPPIRPQRYGDFDARTREYTDELTSILQRASRRFPNLAIAYLSSRAYNGYAEGDVLPEPYSYELAFSVRQVIVAQQAGDPRLNPDPARGPAVAPLVLWGPYIWANGATPRSRDGLTWNRGDYQPDGVHPTPAGARKYSALLLGFLTTDPSARTWFERGGG